MEINPNYFIHIHQHTYNIRKIAKAYIHTNAHDAQISVQSHLAYTHRNKTKLISRYAGDLEAIFCKSFDLVMNNKLFTLSLQTHHLCESVVEATLTCTIKQVNLENKGSLNMLVEAVMTRSSND